MWISSVGRRCVVLWHFSGLSYLTNFIFEVLECFWRLTDDICCNNNYLNVVFALLLRYKQSGFGAAWKFLQPLKNTKLSSVTLSLSCMGIVSACFFEFSNLTVTFEFRKIHQ